MTDLTDVSETEIIGFLVNADLSNVISGMDHRGADLINSNLNRVDLDGSNFR